MSGVKCQVLGKIAKISCFVVTGRAYLFLYKYLTKKFFIFFYKSHCLLSAYSQIGKY
ncbi:Uncharacterized protein dnm_099470 [Desulfonema magnum]|uniref:Uncharacterized protein n=1 Tax=Desulfonema magnum TaxID=45655 RepID=A0A975GU62_9BACT|nr:Uncharacterized protein dnm_099470 [Desulfonema magnum]